MENKTYTAIGLMSGTSLDGVDCALIKTDGAASITAGGFVTIPYTDDQRAVIRAAFGHKDRSEKVVQEAERLVTHAHIAAVKTFMERERLSSADIDLIGFHGQTIYHAPKEGVTVQIGDGQAMAQALGIDVVYDFRSADVKAGGEGAPLAPLYHAARIRAEDGPRPCVLLNIGGVANVTWIGEKEDDLLAFDTGPGNALMDDWVKARTGKAYDEDGMLAESGKADSQKIAQWMTHPYFVRPAPKSLDRDEWDIAALGPLAEGIAHVRAEDGAATLRDFTIAAILKAVELMPEIPKVWYACGGGRHNTGLMRRLKNALESREFGDLRRVDDLGWNGDATEAECFAYLAVRSVLGFPLSLPGTTGVAAPQTGGVLVKAK